MPGFERARLEIDGEGPLECWFNPREYSVTKTNTFKFEPVPGAALPEPQFGGGLPRELTVELLFDSTESQSRDVRDVTDKLLKATEAGEGGSGGRPPIIKFAWGEMVSFDAFIRSLSLRYTMFSAEGKPIRALANITLLQAKKQQDASSAAGGTSGGGNPTTRGIAALRSHVIRDGDSLPSIAYESYGDATMWRPIAEANEIDDPLRLERGRVLAIPRIDE